LLSLNGRRNPRLSETTLAAAIRAGQKTFEQRRK
jgi:hypothetical protein